MENFLNLGISKEILTNLNYLKLFKPTPVQQHAIKPAFDGKDIFIVDQSTYFKINKEIYCKVSKNSYDRGDEKRQTQYEMENIIST